MASSTRKQAKAPPTRTVVGRRPSWKGPIRFGLVSFDVLAVNAGVKEKSDFHFHLLHAPDHERIRYARICPKHGEVPSDEIVDGFEYAKDHYVEVDKDELDALRTDKERSLTIDAFVPPDAVDPIYFDGRMYYLIPEVAGAEEAYALLASAMERQNRHGVGQMVMSGKDQLALVRSLDGVLTLSMLNYEAEIRRPSEVKKEIGSLKTPARALKLAEELIRSWEQPDLDFSQYKDHYREKVAQLVEAKKRGKKIVAREPEEEPGVINLMDALKRSLGSAKNRGAAAKGSSKSPAPARRRPRSFR